MPERRVCQMEVTISAPPDNPYWVDKAVPLIVKELHKIAQGHDCYVKLTTDLHDNEVDWEHPRAERVELPAAVKVYEKWFYPYRTCMIDPACQEPVLWGWPIRYRDRESHYKLLEFLKANGFVTGYDWKGRHILVHKRFTYEDAVAKYGEITSRQRGPKGGFISNTYGITTFSTKLRNKEGSWRV